MPHHHLITNSPFQYEHISNAKSHSLTFNIHRSKTNQGHSGSPRSWSLLSPVLKIGVGRSGRSQGSPGQDHVRGRGATTTFAKLFNLIQRYTWAGEAFIPFFPHKGRGGGAFSCLWKILYSLFAVGVRVACALGQVWSSSGFPWEGEGGRAQLRRHGGGRYSIQHDVTFLF